MVFRIDATTQDSDARAGTLTLSHGEVQTPIFMPVGTLGTVKTVEQRLLKDEVKAQIILGNTYHLYLRPGMEVLEAAGGLHKFMQWDRPMLTDSGGYQVYSLSQRRKITEEGVEFRSHIDGSKHFFSPEKAMDIQRQIGADIMMAFDECPPYPCDRAYATESMHLTHRWLDRCIKEVAKAKERYGYEQILAPIVQGSTYKDLRIASAKYISEQDQPINAIGGLSVGEPHEDMYEMTEVCCGVLPKDKARYLMGVGTPANLLECIDRGIDMFDCVLPTRNARHGLIYTRNGIINIKNAKWQNVFEPIDEGGPCPTSETYSKAYLRHLFASKEYLGPQLASIHNLSFFLWLVGEARRHIIQGDFSSWKQDMVQRVQVRL
jgi:queuine tRNA-ribosyltransferase